MSAQSTMRRPVQLPTRSTVLLVIVLAIIGVVVAALEWPGATTSTPPTGVHHAAPAPAPGPMAAGFARVVAL